MEMTLGERVRVIAVEFMLMRSQWDEQVLGDLAQRQRDAHRLTTEGHRLRQFGTLGPGGLGTA
jgi:hypothetical protein